jgi:hypothetical protein
MSARRRWPLALVILVAAAAIGVAAHRPAAADTGAGAAAHRAMPMPAGMSMTMTNGVTPRELAFRNAMRKLWEQHVAWTRLAIVSFTFGLPDLGPTEARLLRNQVDIGNALKPFYGARAGDRLTALLRRHILVAVAILGDVKTGNQQQLQADSRAWTRNANAIAAFLHRANPRHWPLAGLRAMMHRHLALTTREAVAELSGDYGASVAAYDRVETEILGMADMLSTGIIAQFPHRFG